MNRSPDEWEIRIERIQDEVGFRALRHCWNQLLQESTANTMFLTWEWLYAWFKHLREDRELLILRLSHGEETVGLLPMAVRPHILDNFLGVRVVGFLGMGKAGADYLDVIIRRGWEEHALAALDKFAEENTSLVLRLAQIKRDSFAFRWAARLEHQGWRVSRAKTNVCPFIRLSGHSWQSFLATLGSEHRYNVRRKLRNLSKSFDVQFERVTSEPQCREALSLLITLHNRRWEGLSDAFHTSRLVSFHEEFTQLALARDWLRLFVLRLDGKPAASLYGINYNGVFYFYQSGFDPDYGNHSVGLVTMALAIKAAIEEGAEEYDLLHGDERYKFHWAQELREIDELVVYRPRVAGTFYQVAIQFSRGSRRLARRVLPKTLADAITAAIRALDGLERLKACKMVKARSLSNALSKATELLQQGGVKNLLIHGLEKICSPLLRLGTIYFFVRELDENLPEPKAPTGLTLRPASVVDLPVLAAAWGDDEHTIEKLHDRFRRGDFCFIALDPNNRAIHSRWATFRRANIPDLGMDLILGPGEAFAYDSYTVPEFRGRRIDAAVRCFAFSWLRANGIIRACTFVRGDNPASLRAVRRWQQPAGTFRYIKLRGFKPWVMGKPASCLPALIPAEESKRSPRTSQL